MSSDNWLLDTRPHMVNMRKSESPHPKVDTALKETQRERFSIYCYYWQAIMAVMIKKSIILMSLFKISEYR
jgi:hypothetical protein